jgi:hypothetical protein
MNGAGSTLRARLLHAVRICALAAAAAWLAWLLLANGWLNLGLVGKPVLSINDAEVRVGSAFSWWPGRVRGLDLRVVVHDSNVEMDLSVDRFDLSLSLWALGNKLLHTTKTDVQGVSLRLRATRLLSELCKQAPELPPIFGQAAPPGGVSATDCLAQVETARRKGPPPRPEDLFHVTLENMKVTGMREIWLESYRLEGNVSLQGRWHFWPKKDLDLDLADFQAHQTLLSQGNRRLAQDLELVLAGRLDPILLEGLDSKALWSAVTARCSMRLDSFELKAVRGVLMKADPIAPPKLPGLEGLANIQAGIELEKGHVRSFSLEAQAEQAAMELLDRRLKGSLRLRANLHEDPGHPGRLLFAKGELAIRKPQLEEESFEDVAITLQALGTSRLDPERQRADLDFSAAVSQVRFVLVLIPGGLPRTIAKLLLRDDAPATATGTLHVRAADAEIRDFHAEAGGLSLDGGFVFAPKLEGKLRAKFAMISVDVPLSSAPR